MKQLIHVIKTISLTVLISMPLWGCQAQQLNRTSANRTPENRTPGNQTRQNPGGTAMQATETNSARSAGFATHIITDKYLQNMPMIAVRTPEDWRVAGEPRWNMNEYAAPFTLAVRAYDAAGKVGVEVYPALSFFCLPQAGGYYQSGRNYAGQVYLPPMPVAEVLSRFVIARVRGNRQGLRIVETRPEQVQPMGNARGMTAEAVTIKVEYSENGEMFEEEFHATKIQATIPFSGPQGVMYQVNWNVPEIYSRRAPQGQLAQNMPLFEAIKRGSKINPQWEQASGQVLQQIQANFNQQQQQGYANIAAAGQASRAISANNDAMLGTIEHQRQSSWRPSSGASDHASQQFSDYIRGVNTYDDPYWGQSQHSSNYDYVWSDGTGGYKYSNDSSFNPNMNSNGNWQLMRRQ